MSPPIQPYALSSKQGQKQDHGQPQQRALNPLEVWSKGYQDLGQQKEELNKDSYTHSFYYILCEYFIQGSHKTSLLSDLP